jgi:flagellar protein FlaG
MTMPIDNITQLVASQIPAARSTAGGADGVPVAAARQNLPGHGQNVPAPAAVDIQSAVSRISDYVQSLNRDLKFRVDQDTNQVVVTVMDQQSGEVIRQIPSEEVLAVARSIDQTQKGLLLNAKA